MDFAPAGSTEAKRLHQAHSRVRRKIKRLVGKTFCLARYREQAESVNSRQPNPAELLQLRWETLPDGFGPIQSEAIQDQYAVF